MIGFVAAGAAGVNVKVMAVEDHGLNFGQPLGLYRCSAGGCRGKNVGFCRLYRCGGQEGEQDECFITEYI